MVDRRVNTECTEGFIEGKAFSRSYDLVPPLPLSSKLDKRHRETLRKKREKLLTGGGGAESFDHPRKPGPL
jgi:hypothetical protein